MYNNNNNNTTMETTYLPNMTVNDGTVELIYKCSIFETKRHKKSHTDMYFLKAEHCTWIFGNGKYYFDNGLSRVELIPVLSCTVAYQSAVENSKIEDERIKKHREKTMEEEDDEDLTLEMAEKKYGKLTYNQENNDYTDGDGFVRYVEKN